MGGGSTPIGTDPDPITNHVEVLATLAGEYERIGPVLGDYLKPLYARRAAAIRWALATIAEGAR